MPSRDVLALVAGATLVASSLPGTPASAPDPVAAGLLGAWEGSVRHDGESVPLALELEPAANGGVTLKLTLPCAHLEHTPLLEGRLTHQNGEVRLDPFVFHYDPATGTLGGTIPEALAPVYNLPFTLHRVEKLTVAPRPAPGGAPARPAWTFAAGSPLWPGATWSAGAVYFGGDDGVLHALDARTGKQRWAFRTGGSIRTRPTIAGGQVYLTADDGNLYDLAAGSGEVRWRVRVDDKPIVRLPLDDPHSRYDRFGADVTAVAGRLYVGTFGGHLLALDAATGRTLWTFATGGSVLGAPAVARGRVYAGSFDGFVYALDAATGALVWKRDTRGAVVSTPALDGDRLVVGNRAYDLLALDARSGDVLWRRYVWFSWVESSPSIRDGVVYVGSSDAAAVFAFELRSGRSLWSADVHGWAWGQPIVTDDRVFAGTSSTPGYMGGIHRGAAVALDRRTGRTVWRFAAEAPADGRTYGFPGSAAAGDGLVFFTGLDGTAYAFPQ